MRLATSNANQILFLMLGAVFGVSMAANILIGQATGAADSALAKRVVGTSTTFFIILSLTVGFLGFTFTPAILSAMGTPPDARAGLGAAAQDRAAARALTTASLTGTVNAAILL